MEKIKNKIKEKKLGKIAKVKKTITEFEVPEGIEVTIDDTIVNVKGKEGSLEKNFNKTLIKMDMEKIENKILIKAYKNTKRERKLAGTIKAHFKNMFSGVDEKFTYKLKICFVHFPMNVSYDAASKKLTVKNFLGEKKDRIMKVRDGVDVEIKGDEIILTSLDRYSAGQSAANIEKGTRVKGKDRRIFQDGIFITEKAGREL